MTLSAVWKLYALQVAAGIFDGITSFGLESNDTPAQVHADGSVDPTFAAMISQSPIINFETVKVANALGISALDGYAVAATATSFWQKIPQGGTRGGSSSHIKVTNDLGLVIPGAIQASAGGVASISYRYVTLSSDGEAHPLTIATDQSLTGSPTVDELYGLGPAKYGSNFIDGLIDATIDPGINETVRTPDGHAFPVMAGIDLRRPSIAFTVSDVEAAYDTIGTEGAAISSGTPFKIWLRHKVQGGINTPEGTSSHLLFTINEGRIRMASAAGQAEGAGTAAIVVEPTYDGSNAVIVITDGAAIA